MTKITLLPSVERQRDGRFNLYVPRRDGEPLDQQSFRGQFDSFGAANEYVKDTFGTIVDFDGLHLK